MTEHVKFASGSIGPANASVVAQKPSTFSFLSRCFTNQIRQLSFRPLWRITAVVGLLFLTYVVWLHGQMSHTFRLREAQRTILADAGITVIGTVSPFWKFGALEVWPSSDLQSSITGLKATGTDFATPQGKLAIECISKMGRLQKLSLLNCSHSDQLLSIATKTPIDYLIVKGEFGDHDLEYLMEMRDLRAVRLYNTHATDLGVRSFHSKRSSLRIEVFGDTGGSEALVQLGPLANEVICEPSLDELQLWYPPRSKCTVTR